MQQGEVLNILGQLKPIFAEKYGVVRIGIFGSVARGDSRSNSDVDVVVEMPPDLFHMVHMKEELEARLSAPVELIRYQKNLDELLKRRIDNEAIYV